LAGVAVRREKRGEQDLDGLLLLLRGLAAERFASEANGFSLVGREQPDQLLPSVISFGATAEGAPVLAAMRVLPGVLACRGKLRAPLIPGRLIDDGAVSRHAYAFCVLEQFWRTLKRRDIYAEASTRWRNRRPGSWKAGRGWPSASACDHPEPARRPGRAAGRSRPGAGRRLPGSRRTAGRQHRGQYRRRRKDPPDWRQGDRGAPVAG